MENIDIKALARQLKKASTESNAKNEEVLKQAPSPKKITLLKTKHSSFDDLIKEVNARKDFNCIGGVYVDEEIYDLLRQLKIRNKLKIGYFVSWLIEQYVMENKNEIIASITKKHNKYLSK